MLLKAFKAPSVSISIEIAKDSFVLGETVAGSVRLASDEELEAKEVRVELLGTEKVVAGEEFVEEPGPETPETRLYSPEEPYTQRGNETEYPMYKSQTRLCEKLALTRGLNQPFSFKITIPADLGSSFRGMRPDGSSLERTWRVKGVVVIGGRPDAKAEKEITVGPMLQPAMFPTSQ